MSDSTALCSVCCLRHLSKPSTGWCLDCDEGLCVDCKEHHSLLKATRNHTILPITEYQKLPKNMLEITQNCSKHNELFKIFCKKHDCLCCRKCMIETHNNCKDLVEIEDFIKDEKSSARFNELEEMLNETAENIKRMHINRQENMTLLQEERKKIENDIVQTRVKINNHLDKLQTDLMQDLSTKEAKINKKIQEILQSLEVKQGQLREFQNNFESIKKYVSDVQLFQFMKQMENNMVKEDEFVQSLINSDGLCQVGLVLTDKINMLNITDKMPFIGKVVVVYSQTRVGITKKKDKQAQMMTTKAEIRSMDNITLKFQKKMTACGDVVPGCTMLPHGKMAFANEKEMEIRVVKSGGSLEFEIDLEPYHPFDITYIPDNKTIAVTSNSSNDIKIIDVHTRKVQKTLSLVSSCAGIAYSNGKLILCSKKNGILELNPHDGSIKTIVFGELSSFSHVATLADKIYYTNSNVESVICCDHQGKIQWRFKNQKITCPIGVTVDTDGNVFVADNKSNNVVVISPDGKHYKQLLSSEDGVLLPNSLIYDRDNNQLLFTNMLQGAFLYNVT